MTKRFLITRKSMYVYFKSETWSVVWTGIVWRWIPELGSGIGDFGWVFHWLGILIERCCFDADDWGEQKANDFAQIFAAMNSMKDKK